METIGIEIYNITNSQEKIRSAQSIFSQFGIALLQAKQEFIEIQANSSLEIARHTALEATKALGAPVIREDHSLFINALGIPGPYMSYFEKNMSVSNLLKILAQHEDRTGYFLVATVYADPDGRRLEYEHKVSVHFKDRVTVADPRGGWNGILCLEGEDKAFTEYPAAARISHWTENYYRIALELTQPLDETYPTDRVGWDG